YRSYSLPGLVSLRVSSDSRPSPYEATMRTPHRLQGLLRVAASLVLAEFVCIPVHAQWTKVPAANVPRGSDGKPNLVAPSPRLPDGKPDLSGIWEAEGNFTQNLAKG